MTRRIVIRPRASVDLDEQFAYIAGNNFDAALRFFDAANFLAISTNAWYW